MSHKKLGIPVALATLGIFTAVSLAFNKTPVGVSAQDGDVGDWYCINTAADVKIEETENGFQFKNLNAWGARAIYKNKLAFDGLSFTIDTPDMANQLGDARGFYINNNYGIYFDKANLNLTFSIWSIFGQMRCFVGPNHDYNNASTSLARATMDDTTVGLSSAGGHLVCNYATDFSLNVKFNKIDSDWWKLTMSGATVWKDVNYNGSAGSAFTYIHAADMHLDENDMGYLGFFGLAPHGDVDTIKIRDINAVSGIKAIAPSKVNYKQGEELDLSGLKVKLVNMNGSETDVNIENVTVSGYDKNVYGKQNVNVAYKGFTTSFEVTVENPVTAIAISGEPKVSYNYGESLDLTTFKITRTYENGDVDEIPVTEEMVSGYDKNVVGKQNIAISTDGMMVEVEIDVKDVITGIAVKTLPTKIEYEIGEELDTTGGVIEVSYASGAKKVVDMKRIMVNGYDSSEAGEVTLDVEYEGFHSSFDVTIKEAAVEPEPEPETNNNGCGGSVIAISGLLSLVALGGAALVTYKKKHH